MVQKNYRIHWSIIQSAEIGRVFQERLPIIALWYLAGNNHKCIVEAIKEDVSNGQRLTGGWPENLKQLILCSSDKILIGGSQRAIGGYNSLNGGSYEGLLSPSIREKIAKQNIDKSSRERGKQRSSFLKKISLEGVRARGNIPYNPFEMQVLDTLLRVKEECGLTYGDIARLDNINERSPKAIREYYVKRFNQGFE